MRSVMRRIVCNPKRVRQVRNAREGNFSKRNIMEQEASNLLVPNEEYLKAGIHIGTKFKTKYMENFIYKTRNDGLSVLNIQSIDERIRVAANMLSQYSAEDIIVVSRRENGWKAVRMFGKLTGAKVILQVS